jgi:hypothetical protein
MSAQPVWQPTPCPNCGVFCGDTGATCAEAAAVDVLALERILRDAWVALHDAQKRAERQGDTAFAEAMLLASLDVNGAIVRTFPFKPGRAGGAP